MNPDSDQRGTAGRPSSLSLGALALVFLVVWAGSAWVTDDAYIVFRVVRHAVDGDGLTWNLGQRVQVYTDPLWVLLLSALSLTGASPPLAAQLSSVVLGGLALAVVFELLAGRSQAIAASAALVLLASRTFMHFTSSGLETPLLLFLLAYLLRETLREGPWWRFTLLVSLVVLTRPDGPWLLLPVVCWRALAAWRVLGLRGLLRGLLWGALPLVAWGVFATVYYGTPVPNSVWAKVNTGLPWSVRWHDGVAYLGASMTLDPWLLPVLVAGLSVALAPRRQVGMVRAWAAGVALHLAYVAIAADYIPGRFVAGAFLVALVLAAWVIGAWLSEDWASRGFVATGAAALAVTLTWPGMPLALGVHLPGMPKPWTGDVRDWHAQQREVGHAWTWEAKPMEPPVLARVSGEREVLLVRAAGISPYTQDDAIHWVDVFAITDPLLSRVPARSGVPGHFRRSPPVGYLEVLAGLASALPDPALETYRRHVERLTSGPLFERARWSSMLHLAFVQPRYTAPYVEEPHAPRLPHTTSEPATVEHGASTPRRVPRGPR